MAQSTTNEADMTDLQARSHFRLGKELYDQGKFADAAKEFEVAYGLSGRSSLLYNVYLAYRDAQDTANAARALDGYLAANPNAPDFVHLSARLAKLKEILKKAEEDAASQRAEQEMATQQARDAERARIEADQRARAAEQRAEIKPSRPWWPWLVVGGGVAITATGVVLGMLAVNDSDDLLTECVLDTKDGAGTKAPLMLGTQCAPSVDHESRRDSIQTQALIGDVMWIGGAAITATGLVLALVLPDVYPDAEEAPVTAGCSTDECRATLKLHF
jgi:tetratricopeptide (TPR) repeat protein